MDNFETKTAIVQGRSWFSIYVLLFFLGLALLFTYPLILQATTHVAGDNRSDIWTHLWGYWLTEQSLLHEHHLPTETNLINYPYGSKYYNIDLLNGLVMIPLSHIFGRTLAYNLLIIFQILFGAYAMFLLARLLTRRFVPSIVAGLIYAFCPYMLLFAVASGVSERLNIGWIPLFLFFLLKWLNNSKWRYLGGVVFSFFGATIGCWKYGLFCYLFAGLLLFYLLLRLVFGFIRQTPRQPRRLGKNAFDLTLKKFAPVALVCLFAALPWYLMASSSVGKGSPGSGHSTGLFPHPRPDQHPDADDQPNAAFPQDATGPEAQYLPEQPFFGVNVSHLLELDRFQLVDLVWPPRGRYAVNPLNDRLYQSVFLLYAAVLLALLSLFAEGEYSRFFFPAALVFALLSMGPRIALTPQSTTYNFLFYHFAAHTIPFIHLVETPWEYILPAYLCLATGAAIGTNRLLDYLPKTTRSVAAGTVLLVV